jgi:hypothetical protein
MKHTLNWSLFSKKDRHEAINDLKDIIAENHGWIVTSNFFSDLAMSMTIEIQEKDIACLHTEIGKLMTVSALKIDDIDEQSDIEWWIFLNINFAQGKGDLRIEIPKVPG